MIKTLAILVAAAAAVTVTFGVLGLRKGTRPARRSSR